MPDDPHVILTGRIVRERGMAILCAIGDREEWLPRTQLRAGTTVQRAGEEGRIVIPRWLADKLGLSDSDT